MQFQVDTGSSNRLQSGVLDDRNTWVHWAVTYVDATNPTIKLYRNGEIVGTTTTGRMPTGIAPSLVIGAAGITTTGSGSTLRASTFNHYFAGYIDEVRVFDQLAMSDSDIRLAYANVFTSSFNLVLWVPFTTPDFAAVYSSGNRVDDMSGTQSQGVVYPDNQARGTDTSLYMPAPILWTNNYTNPLCLPKPTFLQVRGANGEVATACAGVGTPYTVYIGMMDWNQEVIPTWQGGVARLAWTGGSGLSWSAPATSISGSQSQSTFANGLAPFTITSTGAQTVTLSSTDLTPIFSPAAPPSTLSITFSNQRYLVISPPDPGAAGGPIIVTISLQACGGAIITGTSVQVRLIASGGASPASSDVTISALTGMGTVTLTADTSLSSTLSLQNIATPGYDLTSTATASWGTTAVSFASKLLTANPQTVSSVHHLQIFSADVGNQPSAFNGTCGPLVTAKGTGTAASTRWTIYLNDQPFQTNLTFSLTSSVIDVVVRTQLVQTVAFSYISYCNLTLSSTVLVTSGVQFTPAALATYTILTPYRMLSTVRGQYVQMYVNAVDQYDNIVTSVGGTISVGVRLYLPGVNNCDGLSVKYGSTTKSLSTSTTVRVP